MNAPKIVKTLEDFGRIQLSKSFFMREFLYSEISQIESIPNIPSNPELAVATGKRLCEEVLEPIQERLGRISVRSAYRSTAVNGKGAENKNQYGCARNESNFARHIWDERDKNGNSGAMACVVVTAFQPYFERTRNWEALAWWIHDHVSAYSELEFFTKNVVLAFNVGWHEVSKKTIHAWAPTRKCLTKPGMDGHLGNHETQYKIWRATSEA